MADEVITKYTADISDFSAKFQEMENHLKVLDASVANNADKIKLGLKSAGDEVDKTKDKVGFLGDKIEELGKTLIAAFAVERIIAFGNSSVEAFAKAEKASFQLLGALNGNTQAQGRMLEFAKQIGEKFAIPQAAINSQSAFLAINGRSEDQIKKTIQAAIQLSAVTGESLEGSVFKLNATYEGNIGRLARLDKGFKDLSKSQLENGAGVDLVLQKYQGFAEKGLEGVAGQMQRNKVEAEELSIKLGERLAPALLAIKTASLQVAASFLDLFTGEEFKGDSLESKMARVHELTLKAFEPKSIEDVKKAIADLLPQYNALIAIKDKSDSQKEQLAEIRAQIGALDELEKEKEKSNHQDTQQINNLENLKAHLEELKKSQEKIIDPLGNGSAENAANVKDQQDTQKKIDEITGKAQEERAKKAQEFAQKQSAFLEELRKKDEQGVIAQAEDETQKKLAEAQKQYDDRIAFLEKGFKDGYIKQQEFDSEIEKAASDLEDGKQKIILAKAAETQKKLLEINAKNAKEDLADTLASIDLGTQEQKTQLEKFYKDKGDFSKKAAADLQKELETIELQGEITKDNEILKSSAATDKEKLESKKKLLQDEQKLEAQGVKDIKATEDEKKQIIEESLQYAGKIGDQLFALGKASRDAQIQNLEEVQKGQDDKYNADLAKLNEQHTNKTISEKNYQAQSAKIKEQQVAADKKVAAEIAEIKRKQAIADKEQAIFNILISTAEAIMKAAAQTAIFAEIFIPVIAALGALELAAVISQPIPKFARGTKGKNASGLSLVGEEGPELTFLPDGAKVLPAKQTRTFGEAIDAMYDNQFDKYVFDIYVAPALAKQKKAFEAEQQKSFAENVANTFFLQNNAIDEWGMGRVFEKMNPRLAKMIGQEIAQQLPNKQYSSYGPKV